MCSDELVFDRGLRIPQPFLQVKHWFVIPSPITSNSSNSVIYPFRWNLWLWLVCCFIAGDITLLLVLLGSQIESFGGSDNRLIVLVGCCFLGGFWLCFVRGLLVGRDRSFLRLGWLPLRLELRKFDF